MICVASVTATAAARIAGASHRPARIFGFEMLLVSAIEWVLMSSS